MINLISHITLSAIMLLSATGLTVSKHYCGDQLIDIGLITLADNCYETDACESHCPYDIEMENSNHCDDETIKFEATSDFFVSSFTFSFGNIQLIDLFFTTQIISVEQSTANSSSFKVLNYKKPPTSQEVVLSQIQSFII